MEQLWDEAYALASREERPTPDFAVPESLSFLEAGSPYLVLKDDDEVKGRGWHAAKDIPAGTIVLVGKPLGLVMDWEGDDLLDDDGREESPVVMEDEDGGVVSDGKDNEAPLNELLLVTLLEKICVDPSLWTERLSTLYPTNDSEADPLPPAHGCTNDALFLRAEKLLNDIEKNTSLAVACVIKKRLPLVIRYNVLSVETASEQLSYPASPWTRLAGVGLFQWASLFNHDSDPNISRWCIGDILFAVSNREIAQGTECCISYIEHDALCEPSWRRNALLQISRMDFMEEEHEEDADTDGPDLPVVDSDVQNELMGMNSLERLDAIDELLGQAMGLKAPDEAQDDDEAMTNSMWFRCDVQNLQILKAITLEGIGQTAMQLWETCLSNAQEALPDNDESVVVLATQTALCAWLHQNEAGARHFAAIALKTHNTIFGVGPNGGSSWFRRRMKNDLELNIRTKSQFQESIAAVDALWPEENTPSSP
jgi:SET domain